MVASSPSLHAAELKQARVSQVIRDVKLLPTQAAPRPAQVSDEVRNGTAVRTGVESRAELTFTDQTLARLGSNSIFSFNEGTRSLELGGGAMLLRVPKNAGGAQVTTAAITAAITGTTIMLEYHPNAYCKFIVLEGTGRIFRNNRVGESVLVHAGQMLIVNPNGKGLPEPVDVDLDRLMKTSGLINGFPPLLSNDLIAREIGTQTTEKAQGGLLNTNLVIFGGGTAVSLLDPTQVGLLDQANANGRFPTPTPTPTATPTPTLTPTPTITPTPPVTPTPSKFGTPSVIAAATPYQITGGTVIATDPTITTNGMTDFGKIYRGSDLDGPASLWLFGSTSDFDNMIGFDQNIFIGDRVPVAAFKFSALSLNGNPTITLGAGGPNNLALISVGDLTSGSPGGALTFAGINFLLLATQNGSITLTSDLAFQDIPTFAAYARGADSVLTFDSSITGSSIVGLLSEGDLQATNSLVISETSESAGLDGLIISLLAGQSINIGQDLTLSISNSDVINAAAINVLANSGDITVNGESGLSLTIENNTSLIAGVASLGVFSGGNLTASAIDLLLNNFLGGTIDGGASLSLSTAGTLATTGDASFRISNGETGGTINSFDVLNLNAAQMSIGGNLSAVVQNNDGAMIVGSASLSVSASSDLTTGGEADLVIDNSAFSMPRHFVGGEITSDATIGLLGGNVSTGGSLVTFIFNDGGGAIDSNALITGGLSGNLSTQGGDLFFDLQNSGGMKGEITVPGGMIDGNATVSVAVAGDITTTRGSAFFPGVAEFAVLNNDQRFLAEAGSILGDALVSLSAANLTTADFFQPLINNTNGIIGGDATVAVNLTGDANVGAETFFNILNTNGAIGGNASSTLTANDFASDSAFEFQIANDGGSIGGSATLVANLAGALTSASDAFIQITNEGGAIGQDASITLTAASFSANSLLMQIDSLGGSIGGNATITASVSGTVTTTADATVNIDLTPAGETPASERPAAVGTIDFNGGSYEVGGTLLSTINGGDGGITIDTAAMHADVVKIGAFGDNGSLTIGGGSISGDTLLKLYATGSNGQINFISNVSLSSNSSVIIAGNAVTVNNGVVVTINGSGGAASVFTDNANYTGSGGNGTTTGTFAGNGATTQPLDQAPPFGVTKPSKNSTAPQAVVGRGGILAHNGQHFPVIRVADSDQLQNLIDKVTSGASNPAGDATSRDSGTILPGKGRDLTYARVLPASREFDRAFARRPSALP